MILYNLPTTVTHLRCKVYHHFYVNVIFSFGRLVRLYLEPNDRLISDDFEWRIRDDSDDSDNERTKFMYKSPRRCHYMHRIRKGGEGGGVTAAFTYCPGSSKVSKQVRNYFHGYSKKHNNYTRYNVIDY